MPKGEFLNMGGYAFYVWSSWALALLILLVNYVAPVKRERQLLRQFTRRERRRTQ